MNEDRMRDAVRTILQYLDNGQLTAIEQISVAGRVLSEVEQKAKEKKA